GMPLANPVVDLVDVVVRIEVGGPRRRRLGLATSHREDSVDRPLPPARKVTGHVSEAPLAHRARLSVAPRPDLCGECSPELLVGALAARTLPGLQRSGKWGMAWYGRRRRLVLLVWRLRGPRQAHVRARHVTYARTAGYADWDGQGLARRGPRVAGRPRQTATG